MDDQRFDLWTRSLGSFGSSRRTLTKLVSGGTLAALLAAFVREDVAAKCVKPGKKCKTKTGRKRCCDGAKCRGKKCKCPGRRQACRKRCCAKGTVCVAKKCRRCDVCAKGCPFNSVQAAVNAAVAGAVIRLCPVTYTGEVTIDRNLTLVGAGVGKTRLSGGGATRVLLVQAGTTAVFIRNLAVTRGRAFDGGGIENRATLTLSDVSVSSNSAASNGGGIYNSGSGTLTLERVNVTSNTADIGGGIINYGSLTVVGSSVTVNEAADRGGGIYVGNNSTITLQADSLVTANIAGISGGGIFNDGGTVTIGPNSVFGNTPNNCRPQGSVTNCDD